MPTHAFYTQAQELISDDQRPAPAPHNYCVTLRLNRPRLDQVEKAVAAAGTSVSELLRKIIEDWLDEKNGGVINVGKKSKQQSTCMARARSGP